MDNKYDVVIVGAGPGGSSTAYHLASAGLEVLLVDRQMFPREKICGDGLTPRALTEISRMGLLDAVQKSGNSLDRIRITGPGGFAFEEAFPVIRRQPAKLVVIRRFVLDNLLLRRAISAGAHFFSEVKVTGVDCTERLLRIRAKAGKRVRYFSARIVVMAVGANTRLLSRLGIAARKSQQIIAARAYFSGIRELPRVIQASMEQVPMPGYGWVFPIGNDSANVGVGYWQSPSALKPRHSAREAFVRFAGSSSVGGLLKNAVQDGKIKSYPLRIDFATAKTVQDRILAVGEAAGLVNPLTGEGVDLALESGRMAAEHIRGMFAQGDLSAQRCKAYDKALRSRYQKMFLLLHFLRRLYINNFVADRTITAASRDRDLRNLFVQILLGVRGAENALKPEMIWKIIRQNIHYNRGKSSKVK